MSMEPVLFLSNMSVQKGDWGLFTCAINENAILCNFKYSFYQAHSSCKIRIKFWLQTIMWRLSSKLIRLKYLKYFPFSLTIARTIAVLMPLGLLPIELWDLLIGSDNRDGKLTQLWSGVGLVIILLLVSVAVDIDKTFYEWFHVPVTWEFKAQA